MSSLGRMLPAVTIGLAAFCTAANADPPVRSGGSNGLTMDDTSGKEKLVRNARPITIHGNQTESVNRRPGGDSVAIETLTIAHEGFLESQTTRLTRKIAEQREGTDPKRAQYNPKEIQVDKVVSWRKESDSLRMAELLVRRSPPQLKPDSASLTKPSKAGSGGNTIFVATAGGGVWKTEDGGKGLLPAQQPQSSKSLSIDVETQKLERLIQRRKSDSTSQSTEKSASGSMVIPRMGWELPGAQIIEPPPSHTMVPIPYPNVAQSSGK